MRAQTIYPGWVVLAACFFCAMLMIGGTLYIFQIFVLPVSEEFGLSRADINKGYMALLAGMALASPFAGRLLDTYSARLLIPLGGCLYCIGFFILSRSHSVTVMLFTILILLSAAICLAGGLAANAVTSRWFLRRRGRALGIASIASSAGGFVMVPIVTGLVETYQWRDALFYSGLAVGILIVLVGFFLVKHRPDETLLASNSEFQTDQELSQNKKMIEDTVWSVPALLGNKNFWLIMFGAGLLLASDQAILTSKYPLFIDAGLSPAQAASIISAMTFSAIIGKFLVGYLADYVDVRHLFAVVALFHVLLLLIFIRMPVYWSILIFASIFGAAVGGIYPVWAALTAANFGTRNFGLVFGSMAPVMQTLAIVFIHFVGSSFDKNGTYNIAFSFFIAAVIIGMLLIYLVSPENKNKS